MAISTVDWLTKSNESQRVETAAAVRVVAMHMYTYSSLYIFIHAATWARMNAVDQCHAAATSCNVPLQMAGRYVHCEKSESDPEVNFSIYKIH